MPSIDFLMRTLEAAGVVVVLSFISLMVLRRRMDASKRDIENGVLALEPSLHAWLVSDADVTPVRDVLRGMRPRTALRSLARLATQQLTLERQKALAEMLRGEAWVKATLRGARSPLWWRRFDAARLLCVVGRAEDAPVVSALLDDPSAAVRLVAIDAAARLPGRPLVDRELDTLPLRQEAVQMYQIAALWYHPEAVADALMQRLQPGAPVRSLTVWIDAAGSLATPAVLEHVRALASHEDGEVRARVASAMRRHASPDTESTLRRLLEDPDWRVRGQSARALGALRCGLAADGLARAVRDPSWWVRFRSALALAQIGGPARDTLNRLTRCDDPMARDMSTLVAGLGSAAVVEMAET